MSIANSSIFAPQDHIEMSPSKAVDLVWYLHMRHSRDYWEVFRQKLGKPVHHTPGGCGSQHLEDYKATLTAYQRLFGMPPKGIWKQNDRDGAWMALIWSGMVCLSGIAIVAEEGIWSLGALWLAISLTIFVTTLNRLTTRGEYTLTFEIGDPFADNDAGDCSAGDCGGCGD